MSQYLEDTFFQLSLNFCYLLQAVPVKKNSLDEECLFLLAIFGKCTPGKYCNDYQTSHVHTLHIQAITHKHT